jgi:hypothetical protein
MAVIHVHSIQDAVSKGAFIEPASDYRTSRTVRACLPKQTRCAFVISTAAFSQQVQQGTVREKQTRMEALCAFLSKSIGLGEKPSPSRLEFRLPGENGETENSLLKLEWYAPNNYWVILLPDEQIQPIMKHA